jgi:hypothetical protein
MTANQRGQSNQSASEQGENARIGNYRGLYDRWRSKGIGRQDQNQQDNVAQGSHG